MSEFTAYKKDNDIDFGDYVQIEQFRHYSNNEMYLYKVIGSIASNTYIDAPIKWDSTPTIHDKMEKVLRVICCGVDETRVISVAQKYCKKVETWHIYQEGGWRHEEGG